MTRQEIEDELTRLDSIVAKKEGELDRLEDCINNLEDELYALEKNE